MSRYSLNLRPKYGQGELTGPERLQQGIGQFLGGYAQRQDQERQERNSVGQAGGIILPDDPADTPRGRWDRLKRGIGGLLGRAEVPPGSDLGTGVTGNQKDGVIPSYTDVAGGLTQRVPNTSGMGGMNGIMPGDRGPLPHENGTAWDERIPTAWDTVDGATAGGVDNSAPHPAPRVASPPMIPGGARTPNGVGPSSGAARTGIAGLLADNEMYTYQGHGFRAQMPNVMGQAHINAHIKASTDDIENEDKIAALVKAGMPADEARARVLNNVVRYDETFGQQRGKSGTNAMTQAERLQIQDRLDARARQAQAVQLQLATGRNMSADARARLTAQLREMTIQSSADQALLRGAEGELNQANAQVTRMQADPVAANTPAGRQAIAATQARADSLGGVVTGARARVSTKATPPAVPSGPGAPVGPTGPVTGMAGLRTPGTPSTPGTPGAKRTITQAQYDRARAMGKTDAEIAALYTIDPSVRRKR